MGNDRLPNLSPNLHFILQSKIPKHISRSGRGLLDTLQVFESVLPPPALLPLNVNSEEVTDTECGCIEKYKLEEVDPANSTRLQGESTP